MALSSVQLASAFTTWLQQYARGWTAEISALDSTIVNLRPTDQLYSCNKAISLEFKAIFVKIVFQTTTIGSERHALHKIGRLNDLDSYQVAFSRILATVERLWFSEA